MSRFSGKQGRGAQARARERRKAEAAARDAACPPERRRKYRRIVRAVEEQLNGEASS